MTDYSSVDLKLKRAEEHLKTFEDVLSAYVSSKPMSLLPQPSDDPLRKPFNVGLTEPPPDSISAIYGDFIHNLLTTLDHLVMALALDNGADPYDPTIQFPICDHADKFFGQPGKKAGVRPATPPKGTGGYQIRALRPDAQAFIEGLQPYRRQRDSWWLLLELQNLDNMDKHRSIIEHHVEVGFLLAAPGGIEIEWAERLRLKHDTYLATVVYPPGYNGMEVRPAFSAGICVEGRNRIAFMDAFGFANHQVLPLVRQQIVAEAKTRFP